MQELRLGGPWWWCLNTQAGTGDPALELYRAGIKPLVYGWEHCKAAIYMKMELEKLTGSGNKKA